LERERRADSSDDFEQTATFYFCDDDDADPATGSKENEYGTYPLPDY